MIPDLRATLEAFVTFVDAVGVDRSRVQASEVASRLACTELRLSAKQTRAIHYSLIERVRSTFGGNLRATWMVGELPVLELANIKNEQDLQRFKEDYADDAVLTFDFELDKMGLVQDWTLDAVASRRVTLFLFAVSFQELLVSSLSKPQLLEEALWDNALSGKAVVLLADLSILINGRLLTVLGGGVVWLMRRSGDHFSSRGLVGTVKCHVRRFQSIEVLGEGRIPVQTEQACA